MVGFDCMRQKHLQIASNTQKKLNKIRLNCSFNEVVFFIWINYLTKYFTWDRRAVELFLFLGVVLPIPGRHIAL